MRILLVVAVVALIVLVFAIAALVYDNARLRRRLKGLDEPELWLPRAERRAHARKLLKREDEQYEQQMIARLSAAIAADSTIDAEELARRATWIGHEEGLNE